MQNSVRKSRIALKANRAYEKEGSSFDIERVKIGCSRAFETRRVAKGDKTVSHVRTTTRTKCNREERKPTAK